MRAESIVKVPLLSTIIFDSDSYSCSLDTNDKSFVKFIKPLLESIKLKETSKIPKINEEYGLSEDEFAKQMDLIHQYKAGNTSALEG